LWNKEFNNLFEHSFLIRHPARTITSYYKGDSHVSEEAIGFRHLRLYFDMIKAQFEFIPPVLDSDDILDLPQALLNIWCKTVGIPYIEAALTWDSRKLKKPKNNFYYEKFFYHQNLIHSTGFLRQGSDELPDITLPSTWLQDIYYKVMPEYEYLYQYRLRV